MTLPGFTSSKSLYMPIIYKRFSLNSSALAKEEPVRPQLTHCPPCDDCNPLTRTQECYKWNPAYQECVSYFRKCEPKPEPIPKCEPLSKCFWSRFGFTGAWTCVRKCYYGPGPGQYDLTPCGSQYCEGSPPDF
jgi:hypothetical protein